MEQKQQEPKKSRKLRKKKHIFYPDDKNRDSYDLFMCIVLLISCLLSPYNIAFVPDLDGAARIVGGVIDILFAIEMCVIFNTAIYDENMKFIDDRKKIA